MASFYLIDTTFILESRHHISSWIKELGKSGSTTGRDGGHAPRLPVSESAHQSLLVVSSLPHCPSVKLSQRCLLVKEACFQLCLGQNLLAPGSHATFWLLLRSRKCAPKSLFNQSVLLPSDRVDIFLSSEKLALLSFISRRKIHNVVFQVFKHVVS